MIVSVVILHLPTLIAVRWNSRMKTVLTKYLVTPTELFGLCWSDRTFWLLQPQTCSVRVRRSWPRGRFVPTTELFRFPLVIVIYSRFPWRNAYLRNKLLFLQAEIESYTDRHTHLQGKLLIKRDCIAPFFEPQSTHNLISNFCWSSNVSLYNFADLKLKGMIALFNPCVKKAKTINHEKKCRQ